MKKPKLESKKYFKISCETFATDVACFINFSMDEAIQYCEKKKLTALAEMLKKQDKQGLDDLALLARMYPLDRGYAVFLNFKKNEHRRNISIFAHELSHVVSWMLMDRRIPLTKDSDEVYAYATEELMKKFLFAWY